ncbi:MAG: Gfo/Idh/MocA family oxidoreductase, partial [Thermoguttaceae bacterium]|nr:Gfo/Idh/MocA family oxidoreductase [Thermoguttaceae bacterium]
MKRLSRRAFLSDSILAAATFSALGPAMTGTKARAQGRPLGPNETLGVMVVGCGGRGTGSHIPEFVEDPRTKILYVCDPDPAQAARAADMVEEAQQFRPKTVSDMREALDDKNLDIVSCATTNHWHALTGIWAMQAGKDAYIEKPICHNVHEGKALVAAAKKYGRCCQVGSQCRSNPAILEAFRYAADGKLGEIKLTRGLCYKRRRSIGPLGAYPVPEGIDYNLWSGPAPII